jgi:hypothetical protein
MFILEEEAERKPLLKTDQSSQLNTKVIVQKCYDKLVFLYFI